MALDYLRIRQAFEVPTTIKFATERKSNISEQITTFLDSYGTLGWELVYYNEDIRDEGYFTISVVFKKTP